MTSKLVENSLVLIGRAIYSVVLVLFWIPVFIVCEIAKHWWNKLTTGGDLWMN